MFLSFAMRKFLIQVIFQFLKLNIILIIKKKTVFEMKKW